MRPDSFVVETFRSLFKDYTKKRTSRHRSFSLIYQLDTESLADVQFVIDSCRLVSQSKFLNSSTKDCDWLILGCFIRE